jgi:hypothetical protein
MAATGTNQHVSEEIKIKRIIEPAHYVILGLLILGLCKLFELSLAFSCR